MGTIDEIHQSLSSIILRLNKIRNFKFGINKLHPDILYNIFTLAVYDSLDSTPYQTTASDTTSLNISHVCNHWRKLALTFPILWGVLDLNKSYLLMDLYIKRSQNAPLALFWIRGGGEASSMSYFLSHTSLILSRLRSLTVHSTYSRFTQFHDAIRSSRFQPLQLQNLDISLIGDSVSVQFDERPELLELVDISCLRELRFIGLDLVPWELPYNKLTHFTFCHPINPPSLPQLLTFLSNCSVLEVLDLAFEDNDPTETTSTITEPMTGPALAVKELVLGLTSLRLNVQGPSSCHLVQQLLKLIRISKALSQFELSCSAEYLESTNNIGTILLFPLSLSKTYLSCWEYLNIYLVRDSSWLEMCAHPTANLPHFHPLSGGLCPFSTHFDTIHVEGYALLELFRNMPRIKHLTLRGNAWSVFVPQTFDLHTLFPSLQTLELDYCDIEVLSSLPATLRLKRLALNFNCHLSNSETLTDFVLRTGVEVLVLGTTSSNSHERAEAASTLREKGVDVVLESRSWGY